MFRNKSTLFCNRRNFLRFHHSEPRIMTSAKDIINQHYPWVATPMVVSAPMRLVCTATMAVAVSKAGGFGFIASGIDQSNLPSLLSSAQTALSNITPALPTRKPNTLPIGVGFIVHGASLPLATAALSVAGSHRPAAVWLFAASSAAQLREGARELRKATDGHSHVWVQVGSLAQAVEAWRTCRPDAIVVQGQDAGGHGLVRSGSVVALVPEVCDFLAQELAGGSGDASSSASASSASSAAAASAAESWSGSSGKLPFPLILAAGGIADGRGVAAALTLGAHGAVMGTRYLACTEAVIASGYQKAVLRAHDGGATTVRTDVYDRLRGTVWPAEYGGRGVVNASFVDATDKGMAFDENKKRYDEALAAAGDEGWGVVDESRARLTMYAGTAVGLVRKLDGAENITKLAREEAKEILKRAVASV